MSENERELPTDSEGKDYDDYAEELSELSGQIRSSFGDLEDLMPEGEKPLPYLGWWLGDLTHGGRISWYQQKYWLDPKGKWPYPSFYIPWKEGARTEFYQWLVSEIERLIEQGGVLHEDRAKFQRKLMGLAEEHGPVTKSEYRGEDKPKESDMGVPTPKMLESEP